MRDPSLTFAFDQDFYQSGNTLTVALVSALFEPTASALFGLGGAI